MNKCAKPMANGLLVFFLLVSTGPINGATTAPSVASKLPGPSTDLQPGEIVEIVIDTLANNDYPFPDAGIETTFNFASPANKAYTEPFEQFVKLVKGPVFQVMIDHRESSFSKVFFKNDAAYRIVQIIGVDNEIFNFAFRLGLQREGTYKDMWLTEAVWPLDNFMGEVLAV